MPDQNAPRTEVSIAVHAPVEQALDRYKTTLYQLGFVPNAAVAGREENVGARKPGLLCSLIGPQRYVVTSIVMLVQYSGNRDDCSSGAAASDLLAASAIGVTVFET